MGKSQLAWRKIQLGVLAGLLSAGMTAAASAAEKTPVFTQYQDWQFQPVTVKGDNVRNQMDFTVPVHGPWLTNPSPTGMTVTWITRIPCAGGIEYREKGAKDFTRLWPVKYGQIDYSRDIHFFHLAGLKPATEYEYRLLSTLDACRTPYHMVVCTGRELYSFKTIDPAKPKYKVFIASDVHGTLRLNLDPMMKRCPGAMDADLYFLLGDNVEDGPYSDIRYFVTFGFLDDIVRVWGKTKPTVFLRGNHDLNGIDTYQYGDYFPQPNARTYQAIAQGPVLFIVTDTMFPAKEKLQNEQYEKYLQEQVNWIRDLQKTDLWKKAKFRILMGHVPPFAGDGFRYLGKFFNPLMSDPTPDGRIHLGLFGHEHVYYRVHPATNEVRVNKVPAYCARLPLPEKAVTPMVVCDLVEAMTLDVSPEKLVFTSWNWKKPEGGIRDSFEILPGGTIKDLCKVPVFPAGPAKKKTK